MPPNRVFILTIDETAEQLGCCRKTVEDEIKRKRLKFARVGRLIRIRQEWIDDYLEGRWNDEDNMKKSHDPSFS